MRADHDRWSANIIGLEGMTGARHRIAGNFAEAWPLTAMPCGHMSPSSATTIPARSAWPTASSQTWPSAARPRRPVLRPVNCTAIAWRSTAISATRCARRARRPWPVSVAGRRLRRSQRDNGRSPGGYATLPDDHMLDENHPWRLSHETDYAITRRDNDPTVADLRVLADDAHELRRRCWRARGADHRRRSRRPSSWPAFCAESRPERRSRAAARGAERRYQSALPNHPYVYACGAYLAAVRSQAGNGSPQRAARSQCGDTGGPAAGRSVGAAHPLSLTALSALANALARAGDFGAAVKQGQEVVRASGPPRPRPPASAGCRGECRGQPVRSVLGVILQADLVDIDFTPLPL